MALHLVGTPRANASFGEDGDALGISCKARTAHSRAGSLMFLHYHDSVFLAGF